VSVLPTRARARSSVSFQSAALAHAHPLRVCARAIASGTTDSLGSQGKRVERGHRGTPTPMGREWGEVVTDSRGCPLLLDGDSLHGLGLDGLLDGLGLGLWWHGGSLPDAAPELPHRPGLHSHCTPHMVNPHWRGREAGYFKSGRASGVPAAPIPAAPGSPTPPTPCTPPLTFFIYPRKRREQKTPILSPLESPCPN
jgi:hypothetical protein